MVISTQHLVPPETTKSKASTAAPDPTPQPGKQTGFGHPLPYPLDLDALVGKNKRALAELCYLFLRPLPSSCPIKDLSRTLPRSQMGSTTGHQHLPLHPHQVTRTRLTKTHLRRTPRPGLKRRRRPQWTSIRKNRMIRRIRRPHHRITRHHNSRRSNNNN